MKLLLTTFGFGVLSSVFPLINMEAYVAGVAAVVGDLNIWLIALIGGIGQSVGKIPWYEVSRSSMDWSYFRKKMEKPDWKRRYDRAEALVQRRPWAPALLLFSSALLALPPLAITAVLAGQLRFNRVMFHLMIISGRSLQFAALLGGVSWLANR